MVAEGGNNYCLSAASSASGSNVALSRLGKSPCNMSGTDIIAHDPDLNMFSVRSLVLVLFSSTCELALSLAAAAG